MNEFRIGLDSERVPNCSNGNAMIPTITGTPYVTSPSSNPSRGSIWKMGKTLGQYVTVTKTPQFQQRFLAPSTVSGLGNAIGSESHCVKSSTSMYRASRQRVVFNSIDFPVQNTLLRPSSSCSPPSRDNPLYLKDKIDTEYDSLTLYNSYPDSLNSCDNKQSSSSSECYPVLSSSENVPSGSLHVVSQQFRNGDAANTCTSSSQYIPNLFTPNEAGKQSQDVAIQDAQLIESPPRSHFSYSDLSDTCLKVSDPAHQYSELKDEDPYLCFSTSRPPSHGTRTLSPKVVTEARPLYSSPLSMRHVNSCNDEVSQSEGHVTCVLAMTKGSPHPQEYNSPYSASSMSSVPFPPAPSEPLCHQQDKPPLFTSDALYVSNKAFLNQSVATPCSSSTAALKNSPCYSLCSLNSRFSNVLGSQSGYNEVKKQQSFRSALDCGSSRNEYSEKTQHVFTDSLTPPTLLEQSSSRMEKNNSSEADEIGKVYSKRDLALPSRDSKILVVPNGCCAVCWLDRNVQQTKTIIGLLTPLNGFCNDLVSCSGCGVYVHRLCYGLLLCSPATVNLEWYCSVCEYWIKRGYPIVHKSRVLSTDQSITLSDHKSLCESDNVSLCVRSSHYGDRAGDNVLEYPFVQCALCQRSGGAFRIGPEHLWVHVSCVLFSSEGPFFASLALLQQPLKIKRSLILHSLNKFFCCLCQGSYGYTVPCSYLNCCNRLHIACAFLARLTPQLEWVTSRQTGNKRLVKLVFCAKHSNPTIKEELIHRLSLSQASDETMNGEDHLLLAQNALFRNSYGKKLDQSAITHPDYFPLMHESGTVFSGTSVPLEHTFKRRVPCGSLAMNRGFYSDAEGRLFQKSSPEQGTLPGHSSEFNVDLADPLTTANFNVAQRRWCAASLDQNFHSGSDWPLYANIKSSCSFAKPEGNHQLRKSDKKRALDRPGFYEKFGIKKSVSCLRSSEKKFEFDERRGKTFRGNSLLSRVDKQMGSRTSPRCLPTSTSQKLAGCKTAFPDGLLEMGTASVGKSTMNRKASCAFKNRYRLSTNKNEGSLYEGLDHDRQCHQRSFTKSVQHSKNANDQKGSSGSRIQKSCSSASVPSGYESELRDSRSYASREFSRTRDSRERQRRSSRASMNLPDYEKKGQTAHLGMGAHIILRGIRLKWSRYDHLFKPTPFLSAAIATIRDGSLPSLETVYNSFVSHINTSSESSLHFLGLFLLAKDPPVRVVDFCKPIAMPFFTETVDEYTSRESFPLVSKNKFSVFLKCHVLFSILHKQFSLKRVAMKCFPSKLFNIRRASQGAAFFPQANRSSALRLNYTSPTRLNDMTTVCNESSNSIPAVSDDMTNRASFVEDDQFSISQLFGYSTWVWTKHELRLCSMNNSAELFCLLETWLKKLEEIPEVKRASLAVMFEIKEIKEFWETMVHTCPKLPLYISILQTFRSITALQSKGVEFQDQLKLFVFPYCNGEFDETHMKHIHDTMDFFMHTYSFSELYQCFEFLYAIIQLQMSYFQTLDCYNAHLFLQSVLSHGTVESLLSELSSQNIVDMNNRPQPWEISLYGESLYNMDEIIALSTISPQEERWKMLLDIHKQVVGGGVLQNTQGGNANGSQNGGASCQGSDNSRNYVIIRPGDKPVQMSKNVCAQVPQLLNELMSNQILRNSHYEYGWLRKSPTCSRHLQRNSFYLRLIRFPSGFKEFGISPLNLNHFLTKSQIPMYTVTQHQGGAVSSSSSSSTSSFSSVNTTTERLVERPRYCILREFLWDLDLSVKDLDSGIVDELNRMENSSKLMNDEVQNSNKEGPYERQIPCTTTQVQLNFVQLQLASNLTLLKLCTEKLYRYKKIYHRAILLNEMIPKKIFEASQCEKQLNMLFSMTSKWGRVSSQCIRGLRDTVESDAQRAIASVNLNAKDETNGGCSFGEKLSSENLILKSPLVCYGFSVPNAVEAVVQPLSSLSCRENGSPLFSVVLNRVKTCCICFEGEWESGNPIFMCSRCCVCVHKGCYAVVDLSGDDENEPFFCKRCDLERKRHAGSSLSGDVFLSGSLRCDCCNTLGGALKRTSHGSWIHMVCALSLLPEVIPGDVDGLDHWDLSGVADWRKLLNCSVCCMSDRKQILCCSGESFSVQFCKRGLIHPHYSYHMDSYPLRLSETAPHLPLLCHHPSRRGVCVVCSYPGCQIPFHPFCAWMAGMYVEVDLDPTSFYPWMKNVRQTTAGAMCKAPINSSLLTTDSSEKPILSKDDFVASQQDSLDAVYFPQLRFKIFCFDHAPIYIKKKALENGRRPSLRSTSYQRCLRHRRYINRDLYPHLCNSFFSTNQHSSDSVVGETKTPNYGESVESGIDTSLKSNVLETSQGKVLDPSSKSKSHDNDRFHPKAFQGNNHESQSFADYSTANDLSVAHYKNASDFVSFLDHYGDTCCAVCFVESTIPLVLNTNMQMSNNLTLDHCRRCGVAVHSSCYNGNVFYSRFFNSRAIQDISKRDLIQHSTKSLTDEEILKSRIFSEIEELEDEEESDVKKAYELNSCELVSSVLAFCKLYFENKESPNDIFFPSLLENFQNGHPLIREVYFTCEVCASGCVLEDVVCLLCSRRGGALRQLKFARRNEQLTSRDQQSSDLFVHTTCAKYCPIIPLETSNRYFVVQDLCDVTQSKLFNAYVCALCSSKQGITLRCSFSECSKWNHMLCLKQHGCFVEQRLDHQLASPGSNELELFEERKSMKNNGVRIVNYCFEHSQLRLNSTKAPFLSMLDYLNGCLELLRVEGLLVRERYAAKKQEIFLLMKSLEIEKPLREVEELRGQKACSLLSSETPTVNFSSACMSPSVITDISDNEKNSALATEYRNTVRPYKLYPDKLSLMYCRCFPMSKFMGIDSLKNFSKIEGSSLTDVSLDVLPPLASASLEELYMVGQSRPLTIAELVDLSRMLLPEYQRRRRGRPSAKEKLVRILTTGVLEYIKSQKQPDETLSEVVKRIPLDFASLSGLSFWMKASFIAEQYGRSFQSILCGTQKTGLDSVVPSDSKTQFSQYRNSSKNYVAAETVSDVPKEVVVETNVSTCISVSDEVSTRVDNASTLHVNGAAGPNSCETLLQPFNEEVSVKNYNGVVSLLNGCKPEPMERHPCSVTHDLAVLESLSRDTSNSQHDSFDSVGNEPCTQPNLKDRNSLHKSDKSSVLASYDEIEEAQESLEVIPASPSHSSVSLSNPNDNLESGSPYEYNMEPTLKASDPSPYNRKSPLHGSGELGSDSFYNLSICVNRYKQNIIITSPEDDQEDMRENEARANLGSSLRDFQTSDEVLCNKGFIKTQARSPYGEFGELWSENKSDMLQTGCVDAHNSPMVTEQAKVQNETFCTVLESDKKLENGVNVNSTLPVIAESETRCSIRVCKSSGPKMEKALTSLSLGRRSARQFRTSRFESHSISRTKNLSLAQTQESLKKVVKTKSNVWSKHSEDVKTNSSNCIATRLRQSVRQPFLIKLDSKRKPANAEIGKTDVNVQEASNETRSTHIAKDVNELDIQLRAVERLWFDDVLGAILHVFHWLPEGFLESYVLCLFSVQNRVFGVLVNVESDWGENARGDQSTLQNLALRDFSIKIQLEDAEEGIRLRQATSLFSWVPLGMLNFLVRQDMQPTPPISKRVILILNHLRLAKNSSNIPLLSFLWFEPANRYLFGSTYSLAFRGKINTLKEFYSNFLSQLKVPDLKRITEGENVLWWHFYPLTLQAPDITNLDDLENHTWYPRQPSSTRLLKRSPQPTISHLKDIVNYFRHLILWLFKQCDMCEETLPPIPGWDVVDELWSGPLTFGVLAIGRSCRLFHVESCSWQEAFIVGYDGAPGSSMYDSPKSTTGFKQSAPQYKSLVSISREENERHYPSISLKHPINAPIKRQNSRLNRHAAFQKDFFEKSWRNGYLVYIEGNNPGEKPIFEWRFLLAFDLLEFATRSVCDLPKLLALDVQYHIRTMIVLYSLPHSFSNKCSHCGVQLYSYWESDSPSEFLMCRRTNAVTCLDPYCSWAQTEEFAEKKEGNNQSNPSYHIVTCPNRVCRSCVVSAVQQVGVCNKKASKGSFTAEAVWDECAKDASWSCTLCEDLMDHIDAKYRTDAGQLSVELKSMMRRHSSHSKDSTITKDGLDKRIKSVLRYKALSSTYCRTEKLKIKQEKQKSTWGINLSGGDKKRQQLSDLKELPHCNYSTKRIRKQK